MNKKLQADFMQLDVQDEKKIVGGFAFSTIISGILALIFGIPVLEKLLSSSEGKVKLPLGISGEWNSEKAATSREIIHSQTVSPTFYN